MIQPLLDATKGLQGAGRKGVKDRLGDHSQQQPCNTLTPIHLFQKDLNSERGEGRALSIWMSHGRDKGRHACLCVLELQVYIRI